MNPIYEECLQVKVIHRSDADALAIVNWRLQATAPSIHGYAELQKHIAYQTRVKWLRGDSKEIFPIHASGPR